jgi:hypothetical protein
MNRSGWIPLALAAALVVPGVARPQTERMAAAKAGEGKLSAASRVEVKAKVLAVDPAARKVTLRLDDGKLQTLLVSEEVENLQLVAVGDTVEMAYYQSLTLALDKVEGAAPELSEKTTDQRAELGKLPGGVRTQEVTVVAKITAIDAEASVVTLTGPKGNSVELEVAPEVLAKVEVGDLVNAVYTQALAVSVSKTPK